MIVALARDIGNAPPERPLGVDTDSERCYTIHKVRQGRREPKEALERKRHWLGGLLLGASLALVLARGVALAQDVRPSNGWDEGTMPAIPEEDAVYFNGPTWAIS